MAKKSYYELLKDPRWQRRRLEILQRSDFSCEGCLSTEKTLHVHHKIYRKGAMPWEYEDHELQALCEDCHAENHVLRARLDAAIALLDHCYVEELLGFAEALAAKADYLERVPVRSAEHAIGIGACFWPQNELEVLDLMHRSESGEGEVDIGKLWELGEKRRAALTTKLENHDTQ